MVYKPMKFPFEKRVKLAQGLWMLSWVATLAAVFTFTLGCILKTEIRKREQVMANSDINIVPNTLIIVGLVSMGINYFAGRISQDALDVGRFPSWKKFLKPYFGISCFFTVLMLLSVVLSFVMRFSLSSSLRIGLKNGIRFYKDTDTPGRCFLKQSVDRVQMDFRCCGNNDHKDWFEVQWISNRFLDYNSDEVKTRVKNNIEGRYLLDSVPFSCCNPASPRPCIQNQLTNDSAHYNYEYKTEELNIYLRGCREALLSYYGNLMTTISVGVLSVFLIQGSVLVSVRYLQTSMESVTASNAESTTEGYLLEKDLKETIKEYLKPVLTILMLNSVDEGEE